MTIATYQTSHTTLPDISSSMCIKCKNELIGCTFQMYFFDCENRKVCSYYILQERECFGQIFLLRLFTNISPMLTLVLLLFGPTGSYQRTHSKTFDSLQNSLDDAKRSAAGASCVQVEATPNQRLKSSFFWLLALVLLLGHTPHELPSFK